MSSVHSGPFRPYVPGLCGWRHHYSGTWLCCDEAAIPGAELCAAHLIEAVAAIDRTEATGGETA